MESFDDLLATSSRALEENPFADPFSNPRSSSPDPWATFGQPHSLHGESYAPHFASSSFGTADEGEEKEDHRPLGDDILLKDAPDECALVLEPEHELETETTQVAAPDETTLKNPDIQSPGFLENVSADESPSVSSAEELSGTSSAIEQPMQPSPSSFHNRTPTRLHPAETSMHRTASSNPRFSSSSPPSSQSVHFISPLDYPNSGVTHSFASLALGGESTGGWRDSQAAFTGFVEPMDTASVTNQIEAESEAPRSEAREQPSSIENRDLPSRPLFSIIVDDPQKVGDSIRPFILYTVHTKTSSPSFNKPSFSVLRRYSDFLWLYETLSMNNPGVIVPPVPEKSSFGRFDNQFVQQRRMALEKCIQKIADHPVLAKDADLHMFLESDSFALDIKHRKTEIAQERGGFMSSIGQTITGPRFYEVDDWFDRKKSYLDGLEAQLKGLVKSIESVSKQRAELATATGEFALAIGELSESDLSKQLSHTLVVMSDVEKKAQDLQHTQVQEDTMTFMSTAEEYTRIISSVRMAFASRVRCHVQWQNAEGELRRVKQVHEKARSQGRISQDRVGHSLAQIADAERRALNAKQDFERCSMLIKSEMAHFEEERITDFKNSLAAFLEGMIQRQKELVASWESHQDILLKNANAAQRPTDPNSQVLTA